MKHTLHFLKKGLALLGLVLCLGWSACNCEPELVGTVANTLHPQETNNWCWAGVTEMIADHFSIPVAQCDLANTAFGRTDCCDPATAGTTCPKDPDCNRPGWLKLTEVGLTFSTTETALSWSSLQKQIYCRKHPLGFAYGTPGVVGHVVVIKGYLTVGGTNYVVLNDPWSPCAGSERLITYDEYMNPAGSSTHWVTWYNIYKTPPPS